MVVIALILGYGLTITVKLKASPGPHRVVTGVTVYVAVSGTAAVLINVPVIAGPDPAEPPETSNEYAGADQI